MKKVSSILLACIALATSITQAQESDGVTPEKWQCFDRFDYSGETVLIRLEKVAGDNERLGVGTVLVAGTTQSALFEIVGFNRRWDFGEEFNYTFIIQPDGDGTYYDFSAIKEGETTNPSQFYRCERY